MLRSGIVLAALCALIGSAAAGTDIVRCHADQTEAGSTADIRWAVTATIVPPTVARDALVSHAITGTGRLGDASKVWMTGAGMGVVELRFWPKDVPGQAKAERHDFLQTQEATSSNSLIGVYFWGSHPNVLKADLWDARRRFTLTTTGPFTLSFVGSCE